MGFRRQAAALQQRSNMEGRGNLRSDVGQQYLGIGHDDALTTTRTSDTKSPSNRMLVKDGSMSLIKPKDNEHVIACSQLPKKSQLINRKWVRYYLRVA
jgi:hypothetical protein